MTDKKKSFVLYHDYQQHFQLLTDEQLGQLIRAIFAYEATGKLPELKDAALKMCFSFVKNQLDRDREAYEARCQANRENGVRGGRPKNPTKPNKTEKTERFSEKPKKPDNDTDTENDNVTDYVKDNSLLSVDTDSGEPINYQNIVSLFNEIGASLPKIKNLSENRKRNIKKANEKLNGDFEGFFRKVENSDFLTGRKGAWSGACFDWIMKPQNFIKIIEGNYDNKSQNTGCGHHIVYEEDE